MAVPRHVIVKWCGRMAYAKALHLQQRFADPLHCDRRQLLESKRTPTSTPTPSAHNTVLMLEHEPVYTVGVRTAGYDQSEEKRLKSLGADFQRTDRGGLITFHGPGQLVVYPILALSQFRSSCAVKWYVTKLEECLIDVCGHFGLKASAPGPPYTGVWVNDRKVAAVGIHVRHGVTSHGIALNCDIDLSWFQQIVPCGLTGKQATSLSHELHRTVTVADAVLPFIAAFTERFDCFAVVDSRLEIQADGIQGRCHE